MHNLLVSQQAERRPGVYDKNLATHQAMQILKSLGQREQQMRETDGDFDILGSLHQSTMTEDEARLSIFHSPLPHSCVCPVPSYLWLRHINSDYSLHADRDASRGCDAAGVRGRTRAKAAALAGFQVRAHRRPQSCSYRCSLFFDRTRGCVFPTCRAITLWMLHGLGRFSDVGTMRFAGLWLAIHMIVGNGLTKGWSWNSTRRQGKTIKVRRYLLVDTSKFLLLTAASEAFPDLFF